MKHEFKKAEETKIKNVSGVWRFCDGTHFIRGYQLERKQYGGRKFYVVFYPNQNKMCGMDKKLFDKLPEAKQFMNEIYNEIETRMHNLGWR